MISISEAATEKVRELLDGDEQPNRALRVFVRGMSCSGPAFGMALDDATRPDDTIAEQAGIKILIDPQSAQYVEGAEIDWVDSLMGKGFTINNPNAAKAGAGGGGGCGGGCACGK